MWTPNKKSWLIKILFTFKPHKYSFYRNFLFHCILGYSFWLIEWIDNGMLQRDSYKWILHSYNSSFISAINAAAKSKRKCDSIKAVR